MKKIIANLFLSGSFILLTGCATMNTVQSKIADMQMQKKQLANGNTVYIDYNVPPTSEWNCKSIDTPQSYNWATLQMQGQFQLRGSHGLLMDKALAYANQQNLNINYINLQIPAENTFTTGSGNVTNSINLNPSAPAIAYYYRCQKINPRHQLGIQRRNEAAIINN